MRNVYKLNPFGLSRKTGERIAYPRQFGARVMDVQEMTVLETTEGGKCTPFFSCIGGK